MDSFASSSSSINQSLSLFVPYMFPNITEARVASVFFSTGLGEVHHVDFISKTDKNGKRYNSAYVHFKRWFDGTTVSNFQERVVNPDKEARVVYDDPWFWIVLENTAIKTEVKTEAKPENMAFVSSDYAAILEAKLAAASVRIEELENDAYDRIAMLEDRVLRLEEDKDDAQDDDNLFGQEEKEEQMHHRLNWRST
jgi:hypothetical protein